jgi:hypothetical protein
LTGEDIKPGHGMFLCGFAVRLNDSQIVAFDADSEPNIARNIDEAETIFGTRRDFDSRPRNRRVIEIEAADSVH